MTKKEKAVAIKKILDRLYPTVDVPLHHKDAFTLLVSVLLSAQCTDERVNKITPLLFAKADNPFDMIKLTQEEIREIIKPCGLSPMKSKGIYGLSKILVERYNGQVPASMEALEELPAVGHKTASGVSTLSDPATGGAGEPSGCGRGRLRSASRPSAPRSYTDTPSPCSSLK
ncbi:MAG: endonuclease III domain-containing protein, partial [Bacteroidota bacterium]